MMAGYPGDVDPNSAVLDAKLAGALRRLRIRKLLRYSGRALCWSALPCTLDLALSKLQLIAEPRPAIIAGVICFAVLAAAIAAVARPISALDVAKLTERRTDLKERLSSAIEFRTAASSDRFYHEQLVDAARYAQGVDLRSAFPMKLPWELPVGALCALAVFLTYYLPTLPRFWPDWKKQEMAEVTRKGLQIEKVARATEKAADQQKLDETKKAAEEAQKLGEQMKKGKLTKKESLVALAKLTKKMEETQQRLAQPPAKKSLAEAHKDFQKALDKLQKEKQDEEKKNDALKSAQKNQLAKDIKKPDQNLDAKPKESEAMRQSREALKQMADALANQDQQQMQQAMQKMAQQMQKGEMSPQEMQQMQQALQQLAQSLQDTNQQNAANEMQQLAQMMQQNGAGNAQNVQQMAQMMSDIGQKMGQGGANMSQMMDAKSLADLEQQLKNGGMTSKMPGNHPGQGGHSPGTGYNGTGELATAMKDPGATDPKLIAMGKSNQPGGKGKQGSAAEFASYLAKSAQAPKHLPNGKIAGTRSENGNELQMSMTGDPQAARSNSPYYQVVQTSKKQAESTLDKENIPASLKRQVKDYFDSIKP